MQSTSEQNHPLIKITPSTLKPHHVELVFGNSALVTETFTLPYLDLRFECPCASCVDEMTGKRTLRKESIKPDIKPMIIQPVGRYGIHVEWSDGHRTGMYHFDTLYKICKNH